MERKLNNLKLKKSFDHYVYLYDWLEIHKGRNIDLNKALEEMFEWTNDINENKGGDSSNS